MKFIGNSVNKRRACKVVEISRSVYYYKRKTPVDGFYEQDVLEVFQKHNGNYGAIRIKNELAKEEKVISKRRIGKILKKHGLESKHGRRKLAKNIHTVKDERFIAENLIKGIKAKKSDQICNIDASEFKYKNGKLIACGIIDSYDKTVVLEYGSSENTELVERTIKRRLQLGRIEILHSDRGSANASLSVKELLEKNSIKRSMSAPHTPNENQYIETFWKNIKIEIGSTVHLTREELIMVLNYQVYYYLNERQHSSIGYETPNYRRQNPPISVKHFGVPQSA